MAEVIAVYTPEQVAEALHCTPRTVYKYLRRGQMPGRKIGGRWRVLEEDLREYIRGGSHNWRPGDETQ